MKDELSTSNEQLLTIDAVVLANGEYPASPLPLKILAEAPYVVCCDGGADEYIRRGHTPDVIIGDGDSSVMKTAGSSDISYTVSATRRPTTRLKPSTSCWRKANAVSPSSVPRANVKTIHWEISACSSTISVPEPMYVPIPITASSSPAGVPAPSQAIPDSKYPSSTSLHTVCMAKDWSIPSAISPTGGKAHSTNAPVQNSPSRRKGNTWYSSLLLRFRHFNKVHADTNHGNGSGLRPTETVLPQGETTVVTTSIR